VAPARYVLRLTLCGEISSGLLLLIYFIFKYPFSNSEKAATNNRAILKDELKKLWKKAGLVKF
jgi:hypothetical protein